MINLFQIGLGFYIVAMIASVSTVGLDGTQAIDIPPSASAARR